MIRYIGVEKDTPDFPRVWGEGKTHTEARLNCEIALREKLLGKINKESLLDLGMRLGEGSGATLALGIIRAAIACHLGMATFEDAGVSNSHRNKIV